MSAVFNKQYINQMLSACVEFHSMIYYVNYSHVGLMLLSLKLFAFSA